MERLLAPLRAPTGRPGYPPLALLRALLLAQWYQLSDPGLEEALADRLSFRRCCGFSLDDATLDGDEVDQRPDHPVPLPRRSG
jgi:transposase